MPYWVFGYGSLIWKPPPHVVEQKSGYVKGVVRRFAQSSIDHRGVPSAPGRVVTVIEAGDWHRLEKNSSHSSHSLDQVNDTGPKNMLDAASPLQASSKHISKINTEEDIVWGVAYRINEEFEHEVRAYLEHREQNGYTCHTVPVYCTTPDGVDEILVVENATIWIGKLDNPAFVGYEPLSVVARLIRDRSGPSGANKDYLYKLAESVRELYPQVNDSYLFTLEAAVKELDKDDIKMAIECRNII